MTCSGVGCLPIGGNRADVDRVGLPAGNKWLHSAQDDQASTQKADPLADAEFPPRGIGPEIANVADGIVYAVN